MKLSVIIPAYNEETYIGKTIDCLHEQLENVNAEVIVSYCGADRTAHIAESKNVKTIRSEKGRSKQLNKGASIATGDTLYFIHADTQVADGFYGEIEKALSHSDAGCFQMSFDDRHWLMRFYGWCTRLPWNICRGGDQSLFIKRTLFESIGGFNEQLLVMEDIDIIGRIKQHSKFTILKRQVLTSARKYQKNGRIRLQLIFAMIHFMYNFGFSQQKILNYYKSNIR